VKGDVHSGSSSPLLTTQHTKHLTSFLLPPAFVTFTPVPKLSEIILNLARFFILRDDERCEDLKYKCLARGCRKTVMKVRDKYSFAMKKADLGLLQLQRTYAIAWKYKN